MQKKIVITGASGYVAGALRERMRGGEFQLKLVSRATKLQRLAGFEESFQSHLDNVASWVDLIKDADFVIHLAALTNLAITEVDPELSYSQNVKPLEMLLEALEVTGRKDVGIIFASTATVVGLNNAVPADETQFEQPISNYDRNKLEAERLLKLSTSKGIGRACSLRFANVYGIMGENSSRNKNRGVINMMIRRAFHQNGLTVFGDGSSVRDFVHISDVVNAMMAVISTPKALNGDSYIVASEVGRTLKQAFQAIANEVNELFGYNVSVTQIPVPPNLHPIEMRNFVGNCSKLKNATGWRPQISFERGIRHDIEALRGDDKHHA